MTDRHNVAGIARRISCHNRGIFAPHIKMMCKQQVEIEIWPPRATVNFRDDWTANARRKQVRFEATVYNSRQDHLWEVLSLGGGPGLGHIDASGLYTPPPKGTLTSGFSEIVAVTAREDRLRRAIAWVTLVGVGAEPTPPPTVEVWPKRVMLYYQQGANNAFMEESNKKRRFNAVGNDGNGAAVEWFVNGVSSGSGESFLYQTPNTGSSTTATIRARLQGQPGVLDEAKVLLCNYVWPGA